MITHHCTHIPQIMLPKPGVDLTKWAVIACDQYTSQPDYWQKTERLVADAPSTLRLTLPELYLESSDVAERTAAIHETMRRYLQDGILETMPAGVILTERSSGGPAPRRGVVMAVDLEAYDYRPGSRSLIRPTEKTVVERIPPRLKIRQGASIELPHIMLLIDDPNHTVIEPLFEKIMYYAKVYETDLMQGGGHLTGWFIPQGIETDILEERLEALCDREVFNRKYGCTEKQALLPFAVGDGNHSMATAKAYWEEVRQGLSEAERENHPARFALVEIVNIHDESLKIEPIHRVLFGVKPELLFAELTEFYQAQGCSPRIAEEPPDRVSDDVQYYPFCSQKKNGCLIVEHPQWSIPVATIQAGLDAFLARHPAVKIDFIHGRDVVKSLGKQPDHLGFLLPDIAKGDLFRGVVFDGVLPRKTFSMGEAHEKRYYMEAKSIVP